MMCSWSRTGAGPPSGGLAEQKNRETDKVEAAMKPARRDFRQRRSFATHAGIPSREGGCRFLLR
eukprot:6190495-Pleurochrysis_carterae.AAC.4